MQTPYVGQTIWFTPVTPDGFSRTCAAIVTQVHSNTCVNLAWFDAQGVAQNATSVSYSEEGTSGTWRNIVAPI